MLATLKSSVLVIASTPSLSPNTSIKCLALLAFVFTFSSVSKHLIMAPNLSCIFRGASICISCIACTISVTVVIVHFIVLSTSSCSF